MIGEPRQHPAAQAPSLRRVVWPAVAIASTLLLATAIALEGAAIWDWINFSKLFDQIGTQVERALPLTVPAMLGLVAILALERLFPADRSQSTLSRDFCLDVVWVILFWPAVVFGTFWFTRGMNWLFDHPLSGAKLIELTDHVPFWFAVGVCFVLGDLMGWCYHHLKHRVPLFWRFHAVHHSPTNINVFTDQRVHIVEPLITRAVATLPFFVIGGDVARTVLWFTLARIWYSRFVHANIRTDLGPLRHVLVTPQFHRMHHSIEPRDAGHNYGTFFSVWDRMFGTMIADYSRYPATGLDDPHFPRPTSRSPFALLRTFAAQLVYPFRSGRSPAPGYAG